MRAREGRAMSLTRPRATMAGQCADQVCRACGIPAQPGPSASEQPRKTVLRLCGDIQSTVIAVALGWSDAHRSGEPNGSRSPGPATASSSSMAERRLSSSSCRWDLRSTQGSARQTPPQGLRRCRSPTSCDGGRPRPGVGPAPSMTRRESVQPGRPSAALALPCATFR